MKKIQKDENAVSPVVGVMLMLVVTIIIAAVVSAFAGGLSETRPKAPQITIAAEARLDDYVTFDHKGGDPINAGTIIVRTFIPSGMFKDMSHKVDLHNATYIATDIPVIDSWGTAVIIQTGDKIKIDWADAFAPSSFGGYIAPGIGEPVNIEIYDATSGKLIVNAQTIVLP